MSDVVNRFIFQMRVTSPYSVHSNAHNISFYRPNPYFLERSLVIPLGTPGVRRAPDAASPSGGSPRHWANQRPRLEVT